MNASYKSFSLFAFMALVLLLPPSVAAQDWGRIMTPDRPLNIRYGRSLNTDRVTTVMPGETVRVDFEQGEWIAVFPMDEVVREESKAIGYVKTKYLRPAKASSTAKWGTLVAPKGMLNIRAKRDRHSEHLITLEAGQVVKIDFEKAGWVAVFKPGETERKEKRALGYAKAKYLYPVSAKQKAAIETTPAASPAETPAETSAKTPEELLAETPVPSSDTAKTAPVTMKPEPMQPNAVDDGASVTVKVGSGTSKPVVSGGASGHDGPWGRVVTLQRRANVRSKRTASSDLVSTLKVGDKVRVDFLERGWYAVFRTSETERTLDRAIGYIYAPLLGEPAVELQPRTLRLEPNSPAAADPMLMADPEPVTSQPDPVEPIQVTPEATVPEPREEVRQPVTTGRTEMTITPQDQSAEPHKGPSPIADKVRHGFKFGTIDRAAGTDAAAGRLLLKLYLELTVIPDDKSLRDFSNTIYREEIGDFEELMILMYLPGQDTKDLAYGQAKFDKSGMLEFWTRRSTLYGTRFQP